MTKNKGIAVKPGKNNSSHIVEVEKRWPNLLRRLITRRVPFENFKKALIKHPEDIKTILIV